MGALVIILVIAIIWWIEKADDIDVSARAMLSEFEKAGKQASSPLPLKNSQKILDESAHKKYGKSITACGYAFLGYIDSNGFAYKWRQVTSVYVSENRETIVAFYRVRQSHRAVDCIEIESWQANGQFLYSTNNSGVYYRDQPKSILMNSLASSGIQGMLVEHFGFISKNLSSPLRRYENIEDVIAGMNLQMKDRQELAKNKEFFVEEEEALRMAGKSGHERIKKIYRRMREIKAKI